MPIADFFTITFQVKRLIWADDGSGNQHGQLSVVGTFAGHLQQANAELVQSLGLTFTKAYSVWCGVATDVKEGDTIVGDDVSYTVRAKQVNNLGENKHMELTVELDEVQGS